MKYQIQFPPMVEETIAQHEEFFFLKNNQKREKIRFHEYSKIYNKPFLYEQLFYERLKCNSPKKVISNLKVALKNCNENFNELRVIDLGAGNGIVGDELKKKSVSRLIGVDILTDAKKAMERDRPDIYDAYYIMDLASDYTKNEAKLKQWNPNALISVAALGFNDIPPKAFLNALKSISIKGWVAFNIKETFLTNSDRSGFSELIKELLKQQYLSIYHLERYKHRLSIEGKPLFYYSIICRKQKTIDKLIKP